MMLLLPVVTTLKKCASASAVSQSIDASVPAPNANVASSPAMATLLPASAVNVFAVNWKSSAPDISTSIVSSVSAVIDVSLSASSSSLVPAKSTPTSNAAVVPISIAVSVPPTVEARSTNMPLAISVASTPAEVKTKLIPLFVKSIWSVVVRVIAKASTAVVAGEPPAIVTTSTVGAAPFATFTPSPASKVTLKSPPDTTKSPLETVRSPVVNVKAALPSPGPAIVVKPSSPIENTVASAVSSHAFK